jgi:hypothetical protein
MTKASSRLPGPSRPLLGATFRGSTRPRASCSGPTARTTCTSWMTRTVRSSPLRRDSPA